SRRLWSHYVNSGTPTISYSEVKLDRKGQPGGNDRKEIFTAVSQLIKYIDFQFREEAPEDSFDESYIFIDALFPVIVFDGYMYRASVNEGKIETKPEDHLVLSVN